MTGCGSESGSRGRYVIGPRLFIQLSIGFSCFFIQQFWQSRDVFGQYIPPISPVPPAATFVFSGSSDTSASVVSISEAMDAAF